MKLKNVLYKLIIYLFILNMLPVSFLAQVVKADEVNFSYQQYDRNNTWIKNKYGIEGKVINVKQFDKCAAILTEKGLYFIKDGKSTSVELSDVSYNSHMKMKENVVYLTPYLYDYSYPCIYSMLRVDVANTFTKKDKLHDEKIIFDYSNELVEAYADFEGNSWFSVLNFSFGENEFNGNKIYRLLRLDGKGNCKEVYTIENNYDIHYDDAFTDMKVDKSNNLWFKVTENNYADNSMLYKLGRATESGEVSFIKFDNDIVNYCISQKGDIWTVQEDNKVLHLDNTGKNIKSFNMKDVKDITVDKDDNVWIIQNNSIKMLRNDEFEVKYNIAEEMTQLSVLNDHKIITAGIKGICLIDGDNVETIEVDNYINGSAFVVSDDKGNIKVLSRDEDYNHWYIDNKFKDRDISITEIDGQGNFKKEALKEKKYLSYYRSKLYNNDIYIPVWNSIYKISRAEKKEYVRIPKKANGETFLEGIEFDKDENIYAFSRRSLYKISNGKVVGNLGVDEISKNIEFYKNKYFTKLLKDKQGDIYAVVNFDENEVLYKINSFNKPELMDEFIYKKDGFGYYPVNIFINEDKELEAVYRYKGTYSVYDLKNGKLNKDVRFKSNNEYTSEQFADISKVVKSSKGRLFILINDDRLLMKDKDSDNIVEASDSMDIWLRVTSIEVDSNGIVYVGTYENGVICLDN